MMRNRGRLKQHIYHLIAHLTDHNRTLSDHNRDGVLFCCFFPTLLEAALADILISCSLPELQVCCCKWSPPPKRKRFQVLAQQQQPRRAPQVYFLGTLKDMTTKSSRTAQKFIMLRWSLFRQSKYLSLMIPRDTLSGNVRSTPKCLFLFLYESSSLKCMDGKPMSSAIMWISLCYACYGTLSRSYALPSPSNNHDMSDWNRPLYFCGGGTGWNPGQQSRSQLNLPNKHTEQSCPWEI